MGKPKPQPTQTLPTALASQGLRIVRESLANLRDAPVNPNVMSQAKYRALVQGIALHGVLQPLIVRLDEDGAIEIVDGHHRKRACIELCITDAPVVYVTLNKHEAAALRIALSNGRGEPDLTATAAILRELAANGWKPEDLSYTALAEDDIRALSRPLTDVDSDNLSLASDATGAIEDALSGGGAFAPAKLTIEFPSKELRSQVKAKLIALSNGTDDVSVGLLNALGMSS